ncbi:lysylphosphatidylglycerol synthase transmembrane domain-containing protein [Streptomyces beijiangensis]|uniref:Flippase-like domain-containing protein n=1 Tax=Streptomyces beijiangensis TaxID=163361 RepID=A0A939F5P8_9ACTN|nr:lysylphosphatidylglycerol synthase transmembrane domain-containing protein [Streptomyces beijiangensis]MBO0511979.1 flippase-like domain-containing protein [Streptomyces beijiangensis]
MTDIGGPTDDGGPEQQLHAFTRQSADRARLIAGAVVITLLVALAVLERAAPDILIGPVVFAAGVVMAVAPAVAAVERLVRHGGRLVADGVLAALVAYLTAFAINLYVRGPAPAALRDALTTTHADGSSTPVHLYIATVVAFVSLVGFGDRLIVRNATWFSLAITAAAALVEHRATLVGVLVSFALGRTVAYGVRWVRGAADTRPTGESVMAALAGADLAPADWKRAPDGVDGARRYGVTTEAGTRLTVTLLDRDRLAVGLAYRLYQRLRLRRPAQSQGLVSLQHIVEQRTLLALAVRDSGIRTPKLAAVRKLGTDAVMLAYEEIKGRTLDELPPEEITDALLERIWRVTAELHRHQISHRRLSTGAFLVDEAGAVWLMRLEAGEVAASELQQRLDDVELLTTLGVLAGSERAVRVAREVLGDPAMGAILPLLRPAVVSAETRGQLRRHKGVVAGITEEILAFQPEAPQSPAVVLERLRPRTILSGLGGVIAAYFLISQFSGQPIGSLFKGMSWPWAVAALGASALTYIAAAMGLGGFVPHRLNKLHLLLAQFAASFVTLVTPAAVGGVALNTRFLQKAGVASGLAVTSMAASQVAGFGAFLLLVMLLGSISGSSQGSYLPPSSVIVTVLLAVGVLGLAAATVPPVRKFVATRVMPFFAGVGPRMLELLSDPRKLLVGLGGAFLLPLAGSLALWACVRAFVPDRPISFATVAVVFLIGKTAGSVVPTPGGLGAVEALLSGGLSTATGIGASTAFSAVILFRLFTFWLPIIPGWLATTWLQKRGAL